MSDWPLLSITIFLPLAGAVFLLILPGGQTNPANTKRAALWVSLITFLLALNLWAGFDANSSEQFQFVEQHEWLPGLPIKWHIGIDGIALFLILLTSLLVPLCIIASWNTITERVHEYMIAFLVLETMMIGVFSALDLVVFYIFFEAVLIPMFLIIGIWGGKRRIYAAFKFFLYTLLGSILMLLAIIVVWRVSGTTALPELYSYEFSSRLQFWLWLAFFASFAVKIPMWPVHTWLPDAHVEAPTAGSVILAGVLLKLGAYGLVRISLPVLPDASLALAPFVFALSGIAVVYASLVALVQKDMKKLVAYSSIAHMGFVTAGLLAATLESMTGAIIQMLSHGIISAALFLIVGVVYDRMQTRNIADYGGVSTSMPFYALVFLIFTLGSVALPGTSGFVGEFLVLAGLWQVSVAATLPVIAGMVLGAVYMLHLYRRVVLGAPGNDYIAKLHDLGLREILMFLPLIGLVFWIGIYPKPFILPIEKSLLPITERLDAAGLRRYSSLAETLP